MAVCGFFAAYSNFRHISDINNSSNNNKLAACFYICLIICFVGDGSDKPAAANDGAAAHTPH